ncbi:MAG: RNA polymerase sigma factor RpoH [Pelagibacterales bacterium]|nr:RNA polymerase sigma factor RpoH [Pelagibacterales bacterium]
MSKATLPSISADGSLKRYLSEISQFPILRKEDEYTLAKNWKEHEDIDAAHTLVTSHLRLVAKIAMGYRGYGLPISDLISEGNIGLMKAVKRFDPDKGFRLATYAILWIKSSIQEHILHSWSLVKMGTTAAQKKLFFNLRRIKNDLRIFEEKQLSPEHIKTISERLVVEEDEVVSMNERIGGDYSLNAPRINHEESGEWLDALEDTNMVDQETVASEKQELEKRRSMLGVALSNLSDRERKIFTYRRLMDNPLTLEELSNEFKISRERVRQLEVKAFEKVQSLIKELSVEENKLVIENYNK